MDVVVGTGAAGVEVEDTEEVGEDIMVAEAVAQFKVLGEAAHEPMVRILRLRRHRHESLFF